MKRPEDLQVGDELTLVRTVDPYRPLYYAAAGGDFNPIHIDPAVGQKAGLGGAILQGLCTMSWMVEAVVGFVGDPTRVAGAKVRFVKPVAIGDAVTFQGRVGAAAGGRATIDFSATNQRGEEVLKAASVVVRTSDGPSGAAPSTSSLPGPAYGPFRYQVGAEKIREFALAIGGGVPSMIYPENYPPDLCRAYYDDSFARERFGALVAPPTFCVAFAIRPFTAAIRDPTLDLNFLMLVHGEQELEFVEPVRAGDDIETTGALVQHFEKGGKQFVVVKTVSRNQHGREVVRGTWTAIIRH